MAEQVAEDVVRAHLAGVLAKVVDALVLRLSPGLDGGVVASLVDEAAALVGSDDAAVALLSAAYQQGREDAGARPLAEGGDVAWADVESPGERKATWREAHACTRCRHGKVCAVSRAALPESLVVVARCLDFE